MKILVSGASGLIGTRLRTVLESKGHTVHALVRNSLDSKGGNHFWNPEQGSVSLGDLEGYDAVINLSGENIASGRWTEYRKKRILESRLQATKTLADAIAKLKHPPKVFVSGSAIGFYGDRGDDPCDESTPAGTGFLANVCRQWEEAALPAAKAGIRTVLLRTGVVLAKEGGALGKMLVPFKLGLGGILGSGGQYMSWIAIDDLVAIIEFILANSAIKGPVNAVAPVPVTNSVFTKTLGKVLNRPTVLPVPAFALRLLLGKEMADEFLLASTRVVPGKLTDAGYKFQYPEVEGALQNLFSREAFGVR